MGDTYYNTNLYDEKVDIIDDGDSLICAQCGKSLYDSPFIHERQGALVCSIDCLTKHRFSNSESLPEKYCEYCEMDVSLMPEQTTNVVSGIQAGCVIENCGKLYCCVDHLLAVNEEVICPICKTNMREKCRSNNVYMRKGTLICSIDCMLKHRQNDQITSNHNKELTGYRNYSASGLVCNFCEGRIASTKDSFGYMFLKYCSLPHLQQIKRNDVIKEEAEAAKRGPRQRFQHIGGGGAASY